MPSSLLARLLVVAVGLSALSGCLGGGDAPGATVSAGCDAPAEDAPGPYLLERPRVTLETGRGNVTLELYREEVPETVDHFLGLVDAGFYDGLRFHRVIGPGKSPPSGFIVQTGDPHTRTDNVSAWGRGGPGYSVPDEFHPLLRHAEGVVSLANQGLGSGNVRPHSAGSQFFITLAAAPSLDDRHSVFGRVVEGMDVVRKIGDVATDANGRPHSDVRLTKVVRTESGEAPEIRHLVHVDALSHGKTTEGGRDVTFVLLLRNLGNVRDALHLRVDAPDGWTCRLEENTLVMPAMKGATVLLTLTPPADAAAGAHEAVVNVTSLHAPDVSWETSVHPVVGSVGNPLKEETRVEVRYAGLLDDGRLFDTNREDVAANRSLVKSAFWVRQPDDPYHAFNFTVGRGVLPGFSDLVTGARVGETIVGRVPPEEAYGEEGEPLSGKTLLFEVEILKILPPE